MFYFKIFISALLLSCFASTFVSSKAVRDAAKKMSCRYELNERKGRYNPIITFTSDWIIYPRSRTVHFVDGYAFLLQCPSTEKVDNRIEGTSVEFLETKCRNGKFYVGDKELDINGVSCTGRIQPRITKRFDQDNNLCAVQGADGRFNNLKGHVHKVEFGYKLRGRYFKLIDACIDEQVYGTLWTRHTVRGRSISNRDTNKKRPSFRADNAYNRRYFNFTSSSGLNYMYSKKGQVETIEEILGTNKLPDGTTILDISLRSQNYIQRGHLSPKADFGFDWEQEGTFYFINVAPQFGSFNIYNWAGVEDSGRKMAIHLKRNLEVTTGTFGIQTFPHVNGSFRQLYLKKGVQEGGHTKDVIPVPTHFWKVIFDKITHRAAALLGMNDVHYKGKIHYLCPNRCDEMKDWIRFNTEDVSRGHVTCCDLESFSQVVRNAPDYRNEEGKWPSLLAN